MYSIVVDNLSYRKGRGNAAIVIASSWCIHLREISGQLDVDTQETNYFTKRVVRSLQRSVGVLAYFLLTGVSPFLAENKALTLSNITQMKIDYPSHLFEIVSPIAVDFIRSLIKSNPKARLSASQCCQHEWLLQQLQQKQAKVEVLAEDGGAGGSGDESISSTSSSSSTSSPTRKRLALDNTVTGSQGSVEIGRPLETLNALPVVGGCCKTVTPRSPFTLEGLSRHHSPVSSNNPHRHHHHQPRRRSILSSLSPSATVAEVSPID
ncbi:unnamed protein product [Hydatigera taeniaeformis]|uniref:Protein kinase domain-containing protein n=1 Tax=Hydatigena taeniaeformis TaxID=6205 RepID=A0A0R3X5N1_HYDTA|nr:unnamed protein product [Hydatigera taeniaeformis]